MGNSVVVSFVCVLFFAAPSLSVADEGVDVSPPRVYQEVGALRTDLEKIRQVLGIRAPRERTFRLAGAESRQTFYQGQTLFRKCNLLAQEIAGASRQAPAPAPEGVIGPADVLSMLQAARAQLDVASTALGIETRAGLPPSERRRTSSDVMHDIVEAGYVINEMINERPDWPAIYDRTLQMIAYVGGLQGEEPQYLALPEFVCCKSPEDVYQSLFASNEAARPLAEKAGLSLVRIVPGKRAEGGASPSTVYDLTTTILNDIGEITLRLDGSDVLPPDYQRPTRILPSHAYQLAVVLRTMLDDAVEGI